MEPPESRHLTHGKKWIGGGLCSSGQLAGKGWKSGLYQEQHPIWTEALVVEDEVRQEVVQSHRERHTVLDDSHVGPVQKEYWSPLPQPAEAHHPGEVPHSAGHRRNQPRSSGKRDVFGRTEMTGLNHHWQLGGGLVCRKTQAGDQTTGERKVYAELNNHEWRPPQQ